MSLAGRTVLSGYAGLAQRTRSPQYYSFVFISNYFFFFLITLLIWGGSAVLDQFSANSGQMLE